MKILKRVKWLLFGLIFLQIYALINLSVSSKYEVDLMETEMKLKRGADSIGVNEIATRSNEISKSKEYYSYSLCFTVFLFLLVYFIIERRKKILAN